MKSIRLLFGARINTMSINEYLKSKFKEGEPNLNTLGSRVRVLLGWASRSQSELIYLMNHLEAIDPALAEFNYAIGAPQLSRVINGSSNPSKEMIVAMACALGTTTDHLLMMPWAPLPGRPGDERLINGETPKEIRDILSLMDSLTEKGRKRILEAAKEIAQDERQLTEREKRFLDLMKVINDLAARLPPEEKKAMEKRLGIDLGSVG